MFTYARVVLYCLYFVKLDEIDDDDDEEPVTREHKPADSTWVSHLSPVIGK